MIPSGAIELCGSSPSSRATSFDGRERDQLAVEEDAAPARGLSRRASARSSVDLPHAFGPTIDRERAVGDRDVEALGDDALVVGERRGRRRAGGVMSAATPRRAAASTR